MLWLLGTPWVLDALRRRPPVFGLGHARLILLLVILVVLVVLALINRNDRR